MMGLNLEAKIEGNLKPSELITYLELHIKLYGDNSVCFMNNEGESNEVTFFHSEGKDGALFITIK